MPNPGLDPTRCQSAERQPRGSGARSHLSDDWMGVGSWEPGRICLASRSAINVRRSYRTDPDGNTDPRLLPTGLRRTNDIAGNPDDAVLLAKQIERLDSLFGEADNSCRWRHVRSR